MAHQVGRLASVCLLCRMGHQPEGCWAFSLKSPSALSLVHVKHQHTDKNSPSKLCKLDKLQINQSINLWVGISYQTLHLAVISKLWPIVKAFYAQSDDTPLR